jgi:hypothetical protein
VQGELLGHARRRLRPQHAGQRRLEGHCHAGPALTRRRPAAGCRWARPRTG